MRIWKYVSMYVLVQCISFISPGAAESYLPLYFPLVTHTSPSSALIYLVSATSFSHSLFSCSLLPQTNPILGLPAVFSDHSDSITKPGPIAWLICPPCRVASYPLHPRSTSTAHLHRSWSSFPHTHTHTHPSGHPCLYTLSLCFER